MTGRPCLHRCEQCARRIARVAVVANVLLGLFKLVTGIIASSTAVMVDGVQSLACAVVAGFIIAGMRVARRPGNRRFPEGYGKVEYLVSIASYSALLGLALFILGSSIYLLASGRSAPPRLVALPVSLISVLGNYLLYRACRCAGEATSSAGLVANAAQNRADMLSSCAVATSVAICLLGPSFYFFDAVGAAVAALMIIYEAAACWYSDIGVLLDRAVPSALLRRADRIVRTIDGVDATRFVRGRRLGRGLVLELGIVVPPDTSLSQAQERSSAARMRLMCTLPSVDEVRVYAYPGQQPAR